MAKSRIDECIDELRALEPIIHLDSLPVQQRSRAIFRLMDIGFDKILADLEYLVVNLPTGDPRRPGAEALLPIVRGRVSWRKEPARDWRSMTRLLRDSRQVATAA